MDTLQKVVIPTLIGLGLAAVGLAVTVRGLYLAVILVHGFIQRARERREEIRRETQLRLAAARMMAGLNPPGMTWWAAPGAYESAWDNPWQGWDVEESPKLREYRNSLVVVQRDRDGEYLTLLPGYIDTERENN